jgi:hypothetical protein
MLAADTQEGVKHGAKTQRVFCFLRTLGSGNFPPLAHLWIFTVIRSICTYMYSTRGLNKFIHRMESRPGAKRPTVS